MTSRLIERDRTSEKDRGGEVKAFPVAIITDSFRQGLRVSPQSPTLTSPNIGARLPSLPSLPAHRTFPIFSLFGFDSSSLSIIYFPFVFSFQFQFQFHLHLHLSMMRTQPAKSALCAIRRSQSRALPSCQQFSSSTPTAAISLHRKPASATPIKLSTADTTRRGQSTAAATAP